MSTEIDQRVIVVDSSEWSIYEHRPGSTEADEATHLVFVSNTEVRRLAVFPETWRTLEDDGLAWLLGVAVTVRHRRSGKAERGDS